MAGPAAGDRETARTGSYVVDMFDPARAALLVIDFQEKLFAAMPPGDDDGGRDRALRSVGNLLFAAGELAIPVLLTEQYPRGIGPTMPAITAALPRSVFRFEKLAFSALREPGFPDLHRPEVIIVGMEAHICVALTAIDLLARGTVVYIVADGCVSRTLPDRARGLALAEAAGAKIVSSETVLFGLIGRAGTPLFKEISRRIR